MFWRDMKLIYYESISWKKLSPLLNQLKILPYFPKCQKCVKTHKNRCQKCVNLHIFGTLAQNLVLTVFYPMQIPKYSIPYTFRKYCRFA